MVFAKRPSGGSTGRGMWGRHPSLGRVVIYRYSFCSTGRIVKTTPWVPASYTHVSRTLKSLLIILVRSVNILYAHMDESHGITVISLSLTCLYRFSASGLHLGPHRRVSLITKILLFLEPPSLAHKLPTSPALVLLLWKQICFSVEARYWEDLGKGSSTFTNRIYRT